jgi:hypothetical protein
VLSGDAYAARGEGILPSLLPSAGRRKQGRDAVAALRRLCGQLCGQLLSGSHAGLRTGHIGDARESVHAVPIPP